MAAKGLGTVWPGVDVVNIFFCDFRQFLANKIGVFLKTQCYMYVIKVLHNLHSYVLSQKRIFFAEFFGENIYKIITSVPDQQNFASVIQHNIETR
jgi:hypothetical protein